MGKLRFWLVFAALAAVAVVIAALGIVNTLTMNVVERVREIGILRAVGMTRRQVWRSVVVEAGILGFAGAILGIALGLVVGAVMVILPGGRLDVAAGIPWQVVGLTVMLGVSVAMLAAAGRLPYEIPFGGRAQFQYLPDVAEAFVRASELDRRGASVHTLDGQSAAIAEVVELIERASGVDPGTITSRGEPLPFPGEIDGSSFVELVGGSVNRSLADGVADSIERLRRLLTQGLVSPPSAG